MERDKKRITSSLLEEKINCLDVSIPQPASKTPPKKILPDPVPPELPKYVGFILIQSLFILNLILLVIFILM